MTNSLPRIYTLFTIVITLLLSACGGGGGGGGKSDTTPDAFSFSSVTNVEPASQQTSASITVSGIDKTTSVSISGGTYSINGAAFATSGNVKAGDTVAVRLTASSSFATQTQATLTIGGVSANFAATTRAADRTPDSFTFTAVTNANFTAQVESTGVTIAGMDDGTPVSVTGGEYAIGTGSYTSTAGTINKNQSIKLRGTTAPTSSTATTVSVTIGTVTQTFSITTTDQAAPQMVTMKLADGTDLKTTINLMAESTCQNCIPEQTQYSWYIEGVTNPVSTTNTYTIADAYRTSKITIVATPKSELGSGETGSVAYKVNQVESITGNTYAFAALKTDGSVTAWGNSSFGGDSSAVQSQLIDVKSIVATETAFAVVRKDGKVVTWGEAVNGGDSTSVQTALTNVESLAATRFAFTAIKSDGSVVTWGASLNGGDSSSVAESLVNVKSVVGNSGVFSAVKNDGSVVTWGNPLWGTGATGPTGLANVNTIIPGAGAFAAIKLDGSVVTWGGSEFGGDTTSISSQLTNAKLIMGNKVGFAFAAIKSDDTVISWGSRDAANSSSVSSSLVNVKSIVSSREAFAALKNDGTVVTWGNSSFGGDSSSVTSQLNNVKSLSSTTESFAALKTNGTIVAWGNSAYGGDTSAVAGSLVGVRSIASGNRSFAAILDNGSVVHWGSIAASVTVPVFTFGNTVLVESNLE
jgi:hypothetical protein